MRNLLQKCFGNVSENRVKSVSETPYGNSMRPVSGKLGGFPKQRDFPEHSLAANARRYAIILQLLYARQGLAGRLERATRGARHLSFGVRLSDPATLDKALHLAEPVALASRSKAVLAYRQTGLVMYQYQLATLYWESYSRADVTGLGVGLGEMRRQIDFKFEESAPHTLVAGTTGSGKTEAEKSILLALTETYTPAQMKLVLIDPHGEYSSFANVAHLATPVATDQEAIDRALLFANQEFERRRARGIDKALPRLTVVIDEGDEVLQKNEQRLGIVRNLVNGRKFKINVILGSLKPTHRDLPAILDKLQNRFVGLVTDATMSVRLTGQAGLEAHKLTGQGDFLHIIGPNVDRFQVAMATEADYGRLERAEIVAPDIEDVAPPELPESRPGRPANELQPPILAQYLVPERVLTVRQARSDLNLSYGQHVLHRNFAADLLAELARLGLHLCKEDT